MLEKFIALIKTKKTKLYLWVLPYTCIFCKSASDREQDLCRGCLQDLPIVTQKCSGCAQKLAAPSEQVCGACLKDPPPFKAVFSLFAYEAPITKLILDLKFHHRLVYARILGELLAAGLKARGQPLPDLVIPVPLHHKRLRERGFNQALEIARPLSRTLGLTLAPRAVRRVKNTTAQMHLPAVERRKNVKNAFVVDLPLGGKKIALVDDVMTTGSTLRELSVAILRAGAVEVEIWCCARA